MDLDLSTKSKSNSNACLANKDAQLAIYRPSYRAFEYDDCDLYDRREQQRQTRQAAILKSDASLEIERRLRRSKGRKLASERYCAPNSELACDGLDLEQLEAIKRDNLTGHQSVTASASGNIVAGIHSNSSTLTGHRGTICTCRLLANSQQQEQVDSQKLADMKPEDLATASCCCHPLDSTSSDSESQCDRLGLPNSGSDGFDSDSDSDSYSYSTNFDSDLKSHSANNNNTANSPDLDRRESKRGGLINSSSASSGSGNLHGSHDTTKPRTQPLVGDVDGQADENECGQLELNSVDFAEPSLREQPSSESKKANSLALEVARSTPSSPVAAQADNRLQKQRQQHQQQQQQASRQNLITESQPLRMQMQHQPQAQKRLAASFRMASVDLPQGGVSIQAGPDADLSASSSQLANEGATTSDQCCEQQQPADPLMAKLVCSPNRGHKLGMSDVNFRKSNPRMQQVSLTSTTKPTTASDEHLYASIYSGTRRTRDASSEMNTMRPHAATTKSFKNDNEDAGWCQEYEYQPRVHNVNYDRSWARHQEANYDEDDDNDDLYGKAGPNEQYQIDVNCCPSQQFEAKRKTSFLGRLKQMLIGGVSSNGSSHQGSRMEHGDSDVSRSNLSKWHRNGFSSVTLSSRTDPQALKGSLKYSSSRKSVNLVGQNLNDDEIWKARSSRLFSGFLTIGRRYTLSSQNNPSSFNGIDRGADITPPVLLAKTVRKQRATNLKELFLPRKDSYGSAQSVDSNSSLPISADSGLSCNNMQLNQSSLGEDQYVSTSVSSSSRTGGSNEHQYDSMQSNFKVVGRAIARVDCNPCAYDKEALVFNQGDEIDILERNESGTWIGRCRGRVGHFKFINITELDTMNSEVTTETGDTIASAMDDDENYANELASDETRTMRDNDNDNDNDNENEKDKLVEPDKPIPRTREGFITKLKIKSKHLQQPDEQAKSNASLHKSRSKSMNNIVAVRETAQPTEHQEVPVDHSSSLEQLLFAIGLAENTDSLDCATYVEIFKDAGIKSLDAFSSIQDCKELKDLGIIDGEHQLRLLMAAKIIRQASQAARQDFLMANENDEANRGASHYDDKRKDFSLIRKAKFNPIGLVHEDVGNDRHSRKHSLASQSNLLIDDNSDIDGQKIRANTRQPAESRPKRSIHQHHKLAKTAINSYYERNDVAIDTHGSNQYRSNIMMPDSHHHQQHNQHHTDRDYSMRLAQQHSEFQRRERRSPRSEHWLVNRQASFRHQQFSDRIPHHQDDLSVNDFYQARSGLWEPSRCFQEDLHSHQEAMHMARVRQANGCGYIATAPSPSLGEIHYSQICNRLISQPKVMRASKRALNNGQVAGNYHIASGTPRYSPRSQINNNSKSAYDLRLDLSHFFD